MRSFLTAGVNITIPHIKSPLSPSPPNGSKPHFASCYTFASLASSLSLTLDHSPPLQATSASIDRYAPPPPVTHLLKAGPSQQQCASKSSSAMPSASTNTTAMPSILAAIQVDTALRRRLSWSAMHVRAAPPRRPRSSEPLLRALQSTPDITAALVLPVVGDIHRVTCAETP